MIFFSSSDAELVAAEREERGNYRNSAQNGGTFAQNGVNRANSANGKSCFWNYRVFAHLISSCADEGGFMANGNGQQQNGESSRPTFPQYCALADYSALTSRELGLTQGEVVELVKIGCAGWWYVRRAQHPWTEGWWVLVLINFSTLLFFCDDHRDYEI